MSHTYLLFLIFFIQVFGDLFSSSYPYLYFGIIFCNYFFSSKIFFLIIKSIHIDILERFFFSLVEGLSSSISQIGSMYSGQSGVLLLGTTSTKGALLYHVVWWCFEQQRNEKKVVEMCMLR